MARTRRTKHKSAARSSNAAMSRAVADAAGQRRAEFFANGGDAKRWGLVAGAGRHTAKPARENKRAARGRTWRPD